MKRTLLDGLLGGRNSRSRRLRRAMFRIETLEVRSCMSATGLSDLLSEHIVVIANHGFSSVESSVDESAAQSIAVDLYAEIDGLFDVRDEDDSTTPTLPPEWNAPPPDDSDVTMGAFPGLPSDPSGALGPSTTEPSPPVEGSSPSEAVPEESLDPEDDAIGLVDPGVAPGYEGFSGPGSLPSVAGAQEQSVVNGPRMLSVSPLAMSVSLPAAKLASEPSETVTLQDISGLIDGRVSVAPLEAAVESDDRRHEQRAEGRMHASFGFPSLVRTSRNGQMPRSLHGEKSVPKPRPQLVDVEAILHRSPVKAMLQVSVDGRDLQPTAVNVAAPKSTMDKTRTTQNAADPVPQASSGSVSEKPKEISFYPPTANALLGVVLASLMGFPQSLRRWNQEDLRLRDKLRR